MEKGKNVEENQEKKKIVQKEEAAIKGGSPASKE